jgi:molecular chaperone HscB
MDPFSTLGLPRRYDIDVQRLETGYRELQKALHPDKHAGASASQRRMSLLKAVEVNEAYRVLKDDLRRAEALLALYDAAAARAPGSEDPEFLMQVMELREGLSEAKAERDLPRVRRMAAAIEHEAAEARGALVEAFDRLAAAHGAPEVARVSGLIGRLKYYKRFLDEVSSIEQEALG